jgi:hypothetical protein
MLNAYFAGSVGQLVQRGRLLIGKIPRDLPRDYDLLAQVCTRKLKDLLQRLRGLTDNATLCSPLLTSERLRLFKRIVAELDLIETVGVAALDRAEDDDHSLNRLLEQVCAETKYPLVTPVVTTLSQQYFCIYPELNLLCVPLTEGRFLLHLPDLYHELAHPLLVETDDPKVEPFQKAMDAALGDVLGYLAEEQMKAARRKGPERRAFVLERWEIAWVKYWMVEFFCDLFATTTLGPAFVWSHLHLSAKRGGNPFLTPSYASSHPADDARMRAMLYCLNSIGFAVEAAKIQQYWADLLASTASVGEPEYYLCFPDKILSALSTHAVTGVRNMGCTVASADAMGLVGKSLNEAWEIFWLNPSDFPKWEEAAVSELRRKVVTPITA